MLWQRLFASFDADHGNRDLIVGTAYAAVMYFALYLIPQAVTAYLIPLVFLPLFGLAIVLKSREIDRDQPMFEDVPRDHRTCTAPWCATTGAARSAWERSGSARASCARWPSANRRWERW